ncbi:BrnT family toxin [Candidatus Saccharibacteria bacterium]|nr:BrnT family toxin [Candidatus Saccharibacteria bacterium]
MKYFDWDEQKNAKLKAERDICFEDVQTAIEEGRILEDKKHPNEKRYPNQKLIVLEIRGYAYLVPCVEDDTKIFMKTIIPSRKATKKFLKKGESQ